ncbi:aminotransferase class-III, partial [mine drainage metagenome]
LCIAKSIGGGIPMSVVAYRDDLVPSLPTGFHLGTYRANPLALAVGTELLRVLQDGDLLAQTAHRGARVVERFRAFGEGHPSIGDVRGRGFMIGVEFVRDRTSRRPWGERARSMRAALFARGLLMHTAGAWDQVLRFMAPLTIEEGLLERGLEAFEDALEELDGLGEAVGSPTGPSTRPMPHISTGQPPHGGPGIGPPLGPPPPEPRPFGDAPSE